MIAATFAKLGKVQFDRAQLHVEHLSIADDEARWPTGKTETEGFPMNDFAMNGRCTCGSVRYRLTGKPLIVHCCHCRWCQRDTGTSFAQNAMIEADRVVLIEGHPDAVWTPTASGKGQKIARCPNCRIALWSNYAGAGDLIRFVRVGTLDEPDQFPPDVHIFTMSKQPWVLLPPGVPAFAGYYDRERVWPAESLARRRVLLEPPPNP